MAATKKELELAYEAGRAAYESEPRERRTADACPFSPIEHPEQREQWLDGFTDAFEDDTVDPAELRKKLKEARDA